MRGVPRIVWVLVGINAALLSIYTLLFPPYTGFDEPQHVDMVVHVAKGDTWRAPYHWPGPGTLPLSSSVANSSNPVYFAPLGPVVTNRYQVIFDDSFILDRPYRPTMGQLSKTPAPPNYPNQMVQHPPAYYALGALVLKAWPGSLDDMRYDQVVGLLRLLSVVLLTPLPLLFFKGISRLTDAPIAVMGAALSMGIPGLTRIGANVQNDDLLILAVTGVTVGLIRVVTGDLTRKTAIAVGLLTALALLTKGFALVLPPVVLAAYAVHRRAGIRPGIWALGVGGLLGGPWYLMNLIRFHKLQTEGLGTVADRQFREESRTPGPHTWTAYVDHVAGVLNRRFWGAIGLPDKPHLPLWLGWSLTIIVTVFIVIALVRTTQRARLVPLLMPVPLMLVLIVIGSQHWWRYNGGLPGVQGRYLYPGLLGTVAVVCVGVQHCLGRRRNLAPLLGLLVAGGMQLLAGAIIVKAYWAHGHDLYRTLRAISYWSPWPTVVNAIPFVALIVLVPWALALAAKAAFSTEPTVQEGEPAV